MNKFDLYEMMVDYQQAVCDEYNLNLARYCNSKGLDTEYYHRKNKWYRGVLDGISDIISRIVKINGEELDWFHLEKVQVYLDENMNEGYNWARSICNMYVEIIKEN